MFPTSLSSCNRHDRAVSARSCPSSRQGDRPPSRRADDRVCLANRSFAPESCVMPSSSKRSHGAASAADGKRPCGHEGQTIEESSGGACAATPNTPPASARPIRETSSVGKINGFRSERSATGCRQSPLPRRRRPTPTDRPPMLAHWNTARRQLGSVTSIR